MSHLDDSFSRDSITTTPEYFDRAFTILSSVETPTHFSVDEWILGWVSLKTMSGGS